MQSVSDDDVRKRLLEKPRLELAAKDVWLLQKQQSQQSVRLTHRVQNALARVVAPNRPPGSSSLHLLNPLRWLLGTNEDVRVCCQLGLDDEAEQRLK